MARETHGRWPWGAAGLVVPTWSAAALRRGELLEDGLWVAGLALPILVSHQTEEWVWPGGFLPFCNQRLLGSDRPDWPLTERDGFHVNVTVGWASALAGLALWRLTPVAAAAVLWIEAGNVLMHTGVAIRERRYNPGVATAARAHGSPCGCRQPPAGSLTASFSIRGSPRGRCGNRICRIAAGDEGANAPRAAVALMRPTSPPSAAATTANRTTSSPTPPTATTS